MTLDGSCNLNIDEEVKYLAVVAASSDDIGVLGVVLAANQETGRVQDQTWFGWIVNVEDIGLLRRIRMRRLELEVAIGNGNLGPAIRTPRDRRDRPLVRIGWITENMDCLRFRFLTLRRLVDILKVVLVDVDSIVLLDALLSTLKQPC